VLFSLQLVLAEIIIAFSLLALAFLGIHAKKQQSKTFSLLGDLDKSASLLNHSDTEMRSVPEQYRDF
jgi:hypothetical protein